MPCHFHYEISLVIVKKAQYFDVVWILIYNLALDTKRPHQIIKWHLKTAILTLLTDMGVSKSGQPLKWTDSIKITKKKKATQENEEREPEN